MITKVSKKELGNVYAGDGIPAPDPGHNCSCDCDSPGCSGDVTAVAAISGAALSWIAG